MNDFLLSVANDYGYIGIFLLIFIENVFPPIPSEVVLLFGGALCASSSMHPVGVIIAATLGSLAGAVLLYAFGYIFQSERIKKIIGSKIGHALHLHQSHVDKAERWFSRYEGKAVLICRCIPIVRSLISIPAGFAKMNMARFLIYTAIGSTVWNSVLVSIGAFLGESWKTALPYIDKYTTVAVIVLVIVCAAAAAVYLLRRRRRRRIAAEEKSRAGDRR